MNEDNLYKLLNVDKNASQDLIKTNYKKLLLLYHPDKKILNITNEEKTTLFLKIRNAYNILSNEYTRKEYDNTLNNSSSEKFNNFSSFIDRITSDIKKVFSFSEYNILLTLLDNKIKNNLLAEANIENMLIKIASTNALEILSSTNIFKILDIDLTIEFTIEQLYLNKSKKVNYSRETKEIFKEKIYPIDQTQIYENEGEVFISQGIKYEGNLNIHIKITSMTYNNIDYQILNYDLYTVFKSIDQSITFIFLDNKEYTFNLSNLSYSFNDFGILYSIENFGLPYYDTKAEFIDETNITKIIRGKLFFLIE